VLLLYCACRVNFRLKSDTDLFEIVKCKTSVSSIEVSPDGKQFSITSPDRRIRVFWFRTGKLRRVYDESLEVMFLFLLEFH
jgi:peptidylprolyl isomerase domain and WD repeat-containing protein 1